MPPIDSRENVRMNARHPREIEIPSAQGLGLRLDAVDAISRPGEPSILADISRAATRLGYAPRFDVRQGLRLAGDWYAANL